jgi:hypothetical protein
MKYSLFWHDTRRILVVSYRLFGQPVGPIVKIKDSELTDCLN